MGDPHWYVIQEWDEVGGERFQAFAALIRAEGHKGRYIRPYNPRPLINHYLELGDGFVYWYIHPNQLCRTRIEWQQHEPIPEQMTLTEEDR